MGACEVGKQAECGDGSVVYRTVQLADDVSATAVAREYDQRSEEARLHLLLEYLVVPHIAQKNEVAGLEVEVLEDRGMLEDHAARGVY